MDDSDVPAVLVDPAEKPFARLLLAHGAGAPMDSGFMNETAAAIAGRGVEVVRFEFPYMAARRENGKRRPPDRMETLLKHFDYMIHHYNNIYRYNSNQRDNDDLLPLFIAGKSMGGRVASVWAAECAKDKSTTDNCRGVVCLGYPFHPPGKSENLRIAHLPDCRIPLLIVQGERDPLGSRLEVESYKLTGPLTFRWLTAADHNLKPLHRSGYTHQQHIEAAADASAAFMHSILSASER